MFKPSFYSVVRVGVTPALTFLGRSPTVEGLHHLPATPVVLASNHLAVIDPLFLSAFIPRRLTFAAKAQYFIGHGVKAQAVRWFLTATGQVPLDRDDPEAASATLDSLCMLLDSGRTVAMFPEGYSSPDGRLFRGKTGPARLARAANVPIVPVAITGTQLVNPPGQPSVNLHRAHVTIKLGEPIDSQGEDLRATTDEVMRRIQEMGHQVVAPMYASVIKEPHKHPELRTAPIEDQQQLPDLP